MSRAPSHNTNPSIDLIVEAHWKEHAEKVAAYEQECGGDLSLLEAILTSTKTIDDRVNELGDSLKLAQMIFGSDSKIIKGNYRKVLAIYHPDPREGILTTEELKRFEEVFKLAGALRERMEWEGLPQSEKYKKRSLARRYAIDHFDLETELDHFREEVKAQVNEVINEVRPEIAKDANGKNYAIKFGEAIFVVGDKGLGLSDLVAPKGHTDYTKATAFTIYTLNNLELVEIQDHMLIFHDENGTPCPIDFNTFQKYKTQYDKAKTRNWADYTESVPTRRELKEFKYNEITFKIGDSYVLSTTGKSGVPDHCRIKRIYYNDNNDVLVEWVRFGHSCTTSMVYFYNSLDAHNKYDESEINLAANEEISLSFTKLALHGGSIFLNVGANNSPLIGLVPDIETGKLYAVDPINICSPLEIEPGKHWFGRGSTAGFPTLSYSCVSWEHFNIDYNPAFDTITIRDYRSRNGTKVDICY